MTPTCQHGDLFENIAAITEPIVIPHVCNDIGRWGSGFVVPLGKKYPTTREAYLEWYREWYRDDNAPSSHLFQLGETQFIHVASNIVVANMVAQHGVRGAGGDRPLRYNALAKCMDSVGRYVRPQHLQPNYEIHCPMFGAGLAGGNWDFIEQLIQDCWVKRDIKVTVHYLGESPL